ncbi:hypothetical protein F0562_003536 [Nyssa sinensis]|uniref:Uncharacterized protein n=1 Tax=Nyssa sinensis TaxID=561372 RepID=A0A5J5BZM7_9ASTE|nr:hypothetical protein F0562_003536 [Nyssa sinensis]
MAAPPSPHVTDAIATTHVANTANLVRVLFIDRSKRDGGCYCLGFGDCVELLVPMLLLLCGNCKYQVVDMVALVVVTPLAVALVGGFR